MNSINALGEILNKYIDKKGNTKTVNLSKIKKNDPILGESIREAISDIDEVIHDEVALMVFESEESQKTGNRTALAKFAEFMDAKEPNKQLKWVNAKVDLINLLIKLSKKYYEYLVFTTGVLKEIPEKTVTICTYQGFARFGFSEETSQMIFNELVEILTQGQDLTNKKGDLDPKKHGAWQQKIKKIIGQSKENARVDFDEFGFDYIVIDEAHNMKKIFTSVANEKSEDESKSRYKLQSGQASALGLKAFCVTHYVQNKNKGRNVCLLTATPFTNSPLEIYSMLSLTNHRVIEDYGFKGLKEFFDYFIRTEYGFVVNAKNQPVKKEEVVGFVNLQSLRNLIYSVIDYKTGEESNVLRPCKITLPIKDTSVICKESAQQVELPMIETIVKPTEQQMKYFLAIENYMLGEDQNEAGIDFGNAEVIEDGDVAVDITIDTESEEDEKGTNDEDELIVKKSNSGTQYIDKIEGNIIYLKMLRTLYCKMRLKETIQGLAELKTLFILNKVLKINLIKKCLSGLMTNIIRHGK
ncbi:MAG: DEAD/DEAH box helicase [Saprospiraceae bacterium]|nr:DEAD/DEAH box helicase [Saprospiraceae bacterium]